jgi:F-type H+-transporting ATPase subunit alpha
MNDLPDSLKPIVKGGGSLTVLPIIETQAGDVSAISNKCNFDYRWSNFP